MGNWVLEIHLFWVKSLKVKVTWHKKNMPVSVFRRNAVFTFAAGFSLRHICAVDAADCRFFHAWYFLQSASTSVDHVAVESADF